MQIDAWRAIWSVSLCGLFAAATLMGLGERQVDRTALALAIGISSTFWLLGALFPMWWSTRVTRATLMNGIAASAAMYAGLAALNFNWL